VRRAPATTEDARRELVLGCATLALAAGYYVLATRIPESGIADTIGAQGLPKAYASMLALLSIILIGRALWARQTAVDSAAAAGDARPRHVGLRTAGMLVVGALYVALVPWLGYPVSVAGLIASTIALQGGRLDRRTTVIAVGGAVLLWLLFVRLLGIPHPSGIWPSML
jgi:hypothetical protein